MRQPRNKDVTIGALAGLLFAGFFLATCSISNDDYLHLASAQQVLLGDRPIRDFIDPGEPLFYLTSALVQRVAGRGLFPEVVLDIAGLSVGFALAFVLGARAAASYVIAAVTMAFAALQTPRLYSYPKTVLYALALTLLWGYADAPRLRRLLTLALLSAIAFLFRHDHGGIIGLTTAAMIVLVHARDGWRAVMRPLVTFGSATAVLLLPFFAYLQLHGGIVPYWRNTLDTSRAEYQRTKGSYPSIRFTFAGIVPVPAPAVPRIRVRWGEGVSPHLRDELVAKHRLVNPTERDEGTWEYGLDDMSRGNIRALVSDPRVDDTHGIDRERFAVSTRLQSPDAIAWFYYLTRALPFLVLATLLLGFRHAPPAQALASREREKMAVAALLGALMHLFLLRAASDTAVADVAAMSAVLAAWLLARGLAPVRRLWRVASPHGTGASRGSMLRSATALVFPLASVLVLSITAFAASESGGGLLIGPMLEGRADLPAVLARLRRSRPPFGDDVARYVHACTHETDRLLVATEYDPDIYFRSGRGFAAGRVYFLTSLAPAEAARAFSASKLRSQRVPIVLVNDDEYAGFARAYPAIDAYLRSHYERAGHVEDQYSVLRDTRITPVRAWGQDRLPCFRDEGDASTR